MLKTEQINKHITLFKRDSKGKSKPLYCKEDMSALGIHINIKGKANFQSVVCEYCGEALDGHTGIGLVNHYEGYCNIDADPNRQFIEICIKKDLLDSLLPETQLSKEIFKFFETTKSGKDISKKKTNFKTQALAKDIFNSPYTSGLDKLYMEAKTLELIHTELNNLFKEDKKTTVVKLSSKDKEAIYYAKKLLSKRIDNPPSIAELSKSVAINELKLKTGFHKFFNETPYNISLEYRLQEAKKLLETSEYNVNEIALKVGYKYAQSFSNAFIKRFGVRPKDVMKSRKYYY